MIATIVLAYTLLEKGDYSRSAYYFRESLNTSSDVNARLFSSYAYALYCSGEEEMGMQYLEQAFLMEPQYALIHYYRGQIFLKQNRLIESEKAFRNAMILSPHNLEYPKYVDLVVQMTNRQTDVRIPGMQ